MYIHELSNWPQFRWDIERIARILPEIRYKQGRLIGHMEALGFRLRQEAELSTLTAEVIKSIEIEGERLDAEQVRSSIARRLGMDIGKVLPIFRTEKRLI
jgi:Fic family protein